MYRKLFLILALLSQVSCLNIYGIVDNPGTDAQKISAARACLDRQDFACANEYYGKISDDARDIRIAELGIVRLQESGIFSVSDLLTALGTGRGGKDTFKNYAEILYSKGKTGPDTRKILSEIYQSVASVQNSQSRAYVRFLSSFMMFNVVLANAITSGKLVETSIVNSVSCRTENCAGSPPECGIGSGVNLSNDVTSVSMGTTTDWDATNQTEATLGQLIEAATSASNSILILTGSSPVESGLLTSIREIADALGSLAAPCVRQQLLTILFPD